MHVAKYSPDRWCWLCGNRDPREPLEDVNGPVRSLTFHQAINPPRHVGSYVHAATRLCNATQKRVGEDIFPWVPEGDGPGVISLPRDAWG